ncbi:N-6 DNA Methylase [Paraburkholderia phenazinium]|uniref:N-6 DNA Methylase n=1 Tax=Paraburkholderia phenazinium TaxID=60549 RepID=A0A1G7YFW2_9BURK|nr:N-6 DNA methylase [Paraburkholderia phenazinium]SDG94770.1 N-6 DNA Methylase [Paraburkholderia phenazinium]
MARKTTRTPSTPFEAFKAHVGRFAQRHPFRSGVKEVLDDLVQVTFNLLPPILLVNYAAGGSVWFDSQLVVELEDYRGHPEAWAELGDLGSDYLALVASAVPFADLLSDLYGGSIAKQQAAAKAQHMTPADMADLLAPFANGADDHGPRRLGDPTCGSGALLLAELRNRLNRHGKAGVANTFVVANDIDPAMVKLATLQITMSSLLHKVPLGCLRMHRADLIKDYHTDGTRVVTVHPSVEKSHAYGFWEDGELRKVEVEVPPLVRVFAALLAADIKANAAHRKA